MTERPTITITAPIAVYGDRVEVLNDRKKVPVWEPGECLHAEYRMYHPTPTEPVHGYWAYRIRLDRESPTGHLMFMNVGEERIRRV